MYNEKMNKELIELLSPYYGRSMIYAIKDGNRKPRYEVMLKLKETKGVPFKAWIDIKKYLNTKQRSKK